MVILRRVFLGVLLLSASASAEKLPLPASLEPAVDFWVRVYSEVESSGGLIHDNRHLDVVYEVVNLPAGLSHRDRERRTDARKKQIRSILLKLATGRRSGLTADEARVLSRWPADVSNSTLRQAADRVRFQLGQANRFREGLARSGAWRSHVERALADEGVPPELVALPHVESSYNPKAYSRVGAAGMWQFTRSTGRLFMRVDSVVDERLDPFVSTRAAARLLAKNREITGAWPLAITAYNHGAAGMKRAASKLGTRDIGEIVWRYRSRSFGFASRNFYVSFLAASRIDRDPTRYFGAVRGHRPTPYEEFQVPWFTPGDALARALGVSVETLRDHNPALRPAVWSGSKFVPKDYTLRLPRGSLNRPAEALVAALPESARHDRQHRDRYHKVRRGETISTIARRYGVSQSALVAANNLRSAHRIRVGQVLVLPGVEPVRAAIAPPREDPPADGRYRVRRGDSLWSIAQRFGVSERELARANGVRDRHRIEVGQSLRIPGSGTPSAAAATPEPAAPQAPQAPPEPSEPEVPELAESVDPPPASEPELPPQEADPAVSEPSPEPVPVAPPAAPAESTGGPDPSDYAVHGNRVTVQAEETLGHFAEWLEVRASRLRQLNGMRYREPVVIGHGLKLDFGRVTPEEFESRRLEYHQSIQNEFFEAFTVVETQEHTLRSGESLWYLANRKFRVPVWLLRQYNPDLDFAALHAGTSMVVPIVEPRAG